MSADQAAINNSQILGSIITPLLKEAMKDLENSLVQKMHQLLADIATTTTEIKVGMDTITKMNAPTKSKPKTKKAEEGAAAGGAAAPAAGAAEAPAKFPSGSQAWFRREFINNAAYRASIYQQAEGLEARLNGDPALMKKKEGDQRMGAFATTAYQILGKEYPAVKNRIAEDFKTARDKFNAGTKPAQLEVEQKSPAAARPAGTN